MAQVHEAQIRHFPHAPSSSFCSLIFPGTLSDILSVSKVRLNNVKPQSFCEAKSSVIPPYIVTRILRSV